MEFKELFWEEQLEQLVANNKNPSENQCPVACLHIRKLGYLFLLVSFNPETNIAFGLCDYDTDIKIEAFDLQELAKQANERGDTITSNLEYTTKHPLSLFFKLAKKLGTLLGVDRETAPLFLEVYDSLRVEKMKKSQKIIRFSP